MFSLFRSRVQYRVLNKIVEWFMTSATLYYPLLRTLSLIHCKKHYDADYTAFTYNRNTYFQSVFLWIHKDNHSLLFSYCWLPQRKYFLEKIYVQFKINQVEFVRFYAKFYIIWPCYNQWSLRNWNKSTYFWYTIKKLFVVGFRLEGFDRYYTSLIYTEECKKLDLAGRQWCAM